MKYKAIVVRVLLSEEEYNEAKRSGYTHRDMQRIIADGGVDELSLLVGNRLGDESEW